MEKMKMRKGFEVRSAAKLIEENPLGFSKMVDEVYQLTEPVNEDYPAHFRDFYMKYVPGVFIGEREIIAVYKDGVILGAVVLKRSGAEKKICTLFVGERYRRKGIATLLIKMSFVWLGTSKPLFSVAEYRADAAVPLAKKFGWVLTQMLGGKYSDNQIERVYNGAL